MLSLGKGALYGLLAIIPIDYLPLGMKGNHVAKRYFSAKFYKCYRFWLAFPFIPAVAFYAGAVDPVFFFQRFQSLPAGIKIMIDIYPAGVGGIFSEITRAKLIYLGSISAAVRINAAARNRAVKNFFILYLSRLYLQFFYSSQR